MHRAKACRKVFSKMHAGRQKAAQAPGLNKCACAHQAWMESKGHRMNILSKNYVEIGIGIATSKKGEKFYTQVFGKRLR